MDFLLLIIGLVMLYRRSYSWLFTIIIILASTYLQINFDPDEWSLLKIGPPHNVDDVGLLLFFLFWIREVVRNGIYIRHPMGIIVIVFFFFLISNGLFDILNGTSIGDVMRYLRRWFFLLIVFIKSPLQIEDVTKSLKQIFWITFIICLVLIVQYVFDLEIIGSTNYGAQYTRGKKPPSFSIICCCLVVLNVFGFSNKTRIITALGFLLPVLFCLKMTYFVTICLTLAICYLIKRDVDVLKLSKYAVVGIVGVAVLFSVSPSFQQRFEEMVAQTGSSSTREEEGNFSYRIDHFSERFEYVLQDPIRSVRGLGYVQERNFHEEPFQLGQLNNWGSKAMLDTGDIAWSLLILRLGILGLLIYLFMYLKCLRLLWRYKNQDELVLVFFSYVLISLVFMSLGNALIATSDFFIYPLLIIGA